MRTARRRHRIGAVVSDKMDKSVIVAVQWTHRHRIYKKAQRRATNLVAHDEENKATVGDIVRIEETRPLSRHKRWRLVEIVQAVDVAEIQLSELEPEAGAVAESEAGA